MGNGKKWEREAVHELRGVGMTAERVPRSVADAMPGPIDDVIVAPSDFKSADHEHRVITHRLQQIDDPEEYMGVVAQIANVEVKYTSNGAHGIATLLDTHKRTVGLGWPQTVAWNACEPVIYSGGPAAFAATVEDNGSLVESYAVERLLPKGTRKLLDDADAAAIRASGEPWVFCWRANDE